MNTLLIVDVQKDFCPGGALAVPRGDRVVPVINAIGPDFTRVIASRDWHPDETVHFESWPPHCIAGTVGAEYHDELNTALIEQEFLKGTDARDDGYSAFEATNEDLEIWLRKRRVDTLYICGLAADFCVLRTVLDALARGFHTHVVVDAVAAVNPEPPEGEPHPLQEMADAGAILVHSGSLRGNLAK